MRCGAKRFLVELEINGKREIKTIIARTPARARKATRLEYGEAAIIISVSKK